VSVEASTVLGSEEVVAALRQQAALRAEFAAATERLAEALREAGRLCGEAEAKLVSAGGRLEGTSQELRVLRDALASEVALRDSLVVRGCLGVLDDLRRASATLPAEAGDWGAGVRLVYDNLEALLAAAGVETLRAAPGDLFNPSIHRAVSSEGGSSTGPPVIGAEVQPGYRAGGKIIRPVEVRVGRPSATDAGRE